MVCLFVGFVCLGFFWLVGVFVWFLGLACFGLFFVGSCLVGFFGFIFSCWLRNEALLHLNILDQCKFRISVLLCSTKQSWQP